MPRDRTFRRTGGQEGFTLIELLLVMLIIAIIAAVLIPSFLNQRTKGFDAAAKSNVRTAAIAEETYAIDHNGTYVSETLSATDTLLPFCTQCGAHVGTCTP